MSFNGSGSFLINTAGQPVVSGTVISSTAFNALTADLATGLSTCITKDGQTTVTANIPMANYKFTGLGVGSGAADSANLSQVQSTVVKLLASVSGTDTITAVGSPTVAAYAAGQMFYFVAAGDNTGAVTINIDSLGAKAVTRDGSVALAAGDIKSGEVVVVVYDGTRFQVVSQLNSSGDARFANVSIASALNVGGVATVTGGAVLNGGVVINEPGADVDFRVEGDTDANLLFVDAGGDKVNIGGTSSAGKLTVTSGGTATTVAFTNGAAASASNTVSTDYWSGNTFGGLEKIATIGAINPNAGTNNGGALYFSTSANGTATSPTERMRLDASGNLGLGVTPSAWGSIFNAMQLGDGGFIAGRSDTATQLQLGCNGFYDGSNFKYIVTGTATRYYMDTGAHYWENAASGTAGNAITFTQAMTLDASGNLGVGETSPTTRLHIKSSGGAYLRSVSTNNTVDSYFGSQTNDVTVYVASNHPLTFATNNAERARITAGGAALFGTNSDFSFAGTPLINSSTANCIFANTTAGAGTGYLLFQGRSGAANVNTAGTAVFTVTDNGDVTNTNNSYGQISDVKTKQDIVDSASQWDDIKAVRVRKFRFKDNPEGTLQIGVVAQELEGVSPGLIEETTDRDLAGNDLGTTTKSVKYSVLYMKAVKALQEAMARIEQLESKVAALESK
jgi:hypothetical protein